VLVLQGGGALGAYQAGAYEVLARAGREADWVAGISIGAINAALIAGNAPERRVARLREFWQRVTAGAPTTAWAGRDGPLRAWANEWAALWTAWYGLPHFFRPRIDIAGAHDGAGSPSLYDTGPLRQTLAELVDFDRINDGPTRLSVGAVDVESGALVFFDSRRQRLRLEHVMASGALPPGFPAVVVEGRAYWDGGVVSNTPLRHVLQHLDQGAATIFQIDLFSADGRVPRTLAEVADREKELRYSSRTRLLTDLARERHELRRALRTLAARLPKAARADARTQRLLREFGVDAPEPTVTLLHLVYRRKDSEIETRDYEFSRASMQEHWEAGRAAMARALRALARDRRAHQPGSFHLLDCSTDEKEHA